MCQNIFGIVNLEMGCFGGFGGEVKNSEDQQISNEAFYFIICQRLVPIFNAQRHAIAHDENLQQYPSSTIKMRDFSSLCENVQYAS